MRVRSLTVSNYKTLRDVTIADIGGVCAFVGPNNSGKSNILDALNFLHHGATAGLKAALDQRGGYTAILRRKGTDPTANSVDLRITAELGSAERDILLSAAGLDRAQSGHARVYESGFLKEVVYRLYMTGDPFQGGAVVETLDTHDIVTPAATIPVVRRQKQGSSNVTRSTNHLHDRIRAVVSGSRFGENLSGDGDAPLDGMPLCFADMTHPPGRLENALLRLFSDSVKHWSWLSPFSNIQSESRPSGTRLLAPDAGNLTDFVNSLHANFPDKFAAFADHVRRVLPNVPSILTPISMEVTTIAIPDEKGAAQYTLKHLSAGTKGVIASLALLHMADEDSLVMMEEPETHLHPRAIRDMVNVFLEIQRQRNLQIFLTTHSPTVLMGFGLDDIILVSRDDTGDSKYERVSSDNVAAVIDQLGIRPCDVLEHELVIFVEGHFDEAIFKAFGAKLGVDLSRICWVPTEGWANIRYYANEMLLEKRNVKPGVMCIFDGDTQGKPRETKQFERMKNNINIPKDNIKVLTKGEIEVYLLDVDAWLKQWPAIRDKLTAEKLTARFKSIASSEQQKESMESLVAELGLGRYTKEVAVKIVEQMSEVPEEIKAILGQAARIVGACPQRS